ncbi:MAG: hypothetical protein AAGA56_06780 [Myxococcota bacterium]
MAMSRRPCGRHAILSDNDGARITQCPCGAVHVLVKTSGVTLQLDEERFNKLGLAVMGAVSTLGGARVMHPTTPTRTIN